MNPHLFRFLIRLPAPVSGNRGAFGGALEIEAENLRPPPAHFERDGRRVVVLGSPIVRGRIDIRAVGERLLDPADLAQFVATVNGSFLFVTLDTTEQSLTIINDRFASIPFYYHLSPVGEFHGAITYTDVWNRVRHRADFRILEEAFYEFIHFQRLLGDKTYDQGTTYLRAGSMLTVDARAGALALSRYWQHDFTKDDSASLDDFGHDLASGLRRAAAVRIGGDERVGMLLSGGVDSRLVLAALSDTVTCFTFGDSMNNEFRIAALAASAGGHHHMFMQRGPDHYVNILRDAVHLGSAMNAFDHAHVLHFGDSISPHADVIVHGHGMDPFFQGTYLPTRRVRIGGRPTFIDRLRPISGRIRDEYIGSIKYRMKSVDSLDIVTAGRCEHMRESLAASVDAVLADGEAYCQDDYDLWEYIYFQNLSRAFSNLNLLSIRPYAEERSISYDNELFDLYLRMPVHYRLSARAHRRAMNILSPELASIENANTNISAKYGPYAATAVFYRNRLLVKLGLGGRIRGSPAREDRSWVDRDEVVRVRPRMRELAERMATSEALASLEFIDMDAVAGFVRAHLDRNGHHGDLISTLLTVDEFLKQGDRASGPNS